MCTENRYYYLQGHLTHSILFMNVTQAIVKDYTHSAFIHPTSYNCLISLWDKKLKRLGRISAYFRYIIVPIVDITSTNVVTAVTVPLLVPPSKPLRKFIPLSQIDNNDQASSELVNTNVNKINIQALEKHQNNERYQQLLRFQTVSHYEEPHLFT